MSARFARHAATAAVSLSLIATAAAFAPPAQAAPSLKARLEARGALAASWDASQLTKGRIHNTEFDFDDWGLTIDTAFALAAADRKRPVARIAGALARNQESYYSYMGDLFAGAVGKTLVAAKVLKQDPRDFGDVNVRRLTLDLLAPATDGFERGRARDKTTFDDSSNTLGQSYVVLGLARTGGVPQDAVNYLRKQQCDDGFFREMMEAGEDCDTTGSKASIDATALAIHALEAAKRSGATVGTSMGRAGRWLVDHQRGNGSFGQGSFGPNANSTGLAGSALWITGRNAAANEASAWVSSLQLTKARAAKGRDIGAIAYNKAARNAAAKDAITTATRDQFQRATPQAMLTLYRVSLARLTAP